jgi:hypothetical protein
MAQKQRQYEGGLDSVFSFIFAGAKQKSKVVSKRPIPGIGGDEMASALAEIAMAPAIYASEEILTPLNEFFDAVSIAEAKVQLDKENAVKVGLSAKDIGGFFNDPDGFVDGVFTKTEGIKKQARTLNFIRGFGGVMDLGIGATIARKNGNSSINSVEMGRILGSEYMSQEQRDEKAEHLAAFTSALEAGKARGLDYNSASELAKTFAAVIDPSLGKAGGDRNQLSRVVEKKMRGMGVAVTPDQLNELLDKYEARTTKYQKKGKVRIGEVDKSWSLGKLDRDVNKEYAQKVDFQGGPDAWMGSDNPADKLRALKFEELKAKIDLLPDSDLRKKIFARDLKQLETWQVSNGKNMRWSRYLGEAYLNVSHLNMLILQGGLGTALWKGDFFDTRKNNLAPSKKEKFMLNGKDYGEIYVARNDMKRAYTWMTSLYYLTPGSLAKTLFVNGEGFIYMQHLQKEKIRRSIKGSDSLFSAIRDSGEGAENPFRQLLGEGIAISGNQEEILKYLASGDNYKNLLKILEDNRELVLANPELADLYKYIGKLNGKIDRSVLLKYAASIQKVIGALSPKKWFDTLAKGGLRLFLGKKLGEKAIAFFFNGKVILKKAIKRAAKTAVHAFMQSLGLATTGGLANGLIWIVTEVGYFISEKVLKVFIKIGYAFLWVFGVVLFGLFTEVLSFLNPLAPISDSVSSQFSTGGNTSPNFLETCAVGSYNPTDGTYDDWQPGEDGGGGGGGDQTPPPNMGDVRCPLQPSPLRCSQGPYGGFSHGGNNAIDVPGPPPSYWYAPSDAVVTRSTWAYENSRVPGQLCGGIVHIYSAQHDITYVLVHVVPYVNQNDQVKKGEPIAKMAVAGDGNIHFGNHSGTCATGAHFHLEVRGTGIRADQFYRNQLNCELGSCP